MEKLITLRFPTKCSKCGQQISAGDHAYWNAGNAGKKVRHVQCEIEKPEELNRPKDEKHGTTTFDYSTFRKVFLDLARTGKVPADFLSRAGNRKHLQEHYDGIMIGFHNWVGATVTEMSDWIENGYRVASLGDMPATLIPARPRRKIRYGEEGDELLIDLAWSGSDEPFMEWEKRQSKPGLSVEIMYTWNSDIKASTIADYSRWNARMLQTFDEFGIDLEVNITMPNDGLPISGAKMHYCNIRVKNAGEASDISAWSAMFSPGAYRTMGFMAWWKSCDVAGVDAPYGLGHAPSYPWDVTYEKETGRIVISCGTSDFPEAEMTDKLRLLLNEISNG